jgi:hypothetical protein
MTLTPAKLAGLLRAAFSTALEACAPGAARYVAAPAGPVMHTFTCVLSELGLLRQSLVWIKDVFVLGHSDYHYRHETVLGRCRSRPSSGSWMATGKIASTLRSRYPLRAYPNALKAPTMPCKGCGTTPSTNSPRWDWPLPLTGTR